MINIYKYNRTVPIFRNVSNEGLENTDAMFNDSITLHRNMDNTINFKLTDRDRRSVQFDNKNLCVRVVDDTSHLIVDTFYLSSTDNAKIFKATLPSSFVNQLEPRRGYSFYVGLESADGAMEPIYIDHDFTITGSIEVIDNYSEVVEEKLEGYSQREDNLEKEVNGEYYLESYIESDGDFRRLDFRTYDDQTSDPITLKIEKHRGKYFPVYTEDNIQWEEFIQVSNVHAHSWSFVELPEGKYRAVLITDTPEQYFFVVSNIKRL